MEKTHNKTYCNDWVKSINNLTNVSLAQNDENVDRTPFDLSSLDITSVSRNKPEYSVEKHEKFISQKKKDHQFTTVPKRKPESETM